MNPAGFLFRTLLLALFTLSLLAGAIITDYYLRHELTGKSARYLSSRGIEASTDSAISAAGEGEVVMLENLERAGIDLGDSDSRGFTPLLAAIRSGNGPAIQFLMERNGVVENINQFTNPDRQTPLSAALSERDFDLASKLLEAGALIEVDKEAGKPFLIDAIETQDEEMLEFLFDNGVDLEYRGTEVSTALAVAASLDNLSLMKRLILKGAEIYVRGLSGSPLLVDAVREGNLKKFDLLISSGADVNIKNGESIEMTPLSYALESHNKRMQERLLEKGADANVVGTSGAPLIYEAVSAGDKKTIVRLLDSGANPNVMTTSGETPLAFAIAGEDLEMVDLLLSNGADASLTSSGGQSPLLVAVAEGNIAIANLLIVAGAELDKQTLLAKAYELRDDPLMNLLLYAGADPESTFPESKERVFDAAVKDGATGAVRTLLAAGATIGDNLWAALLTGQDDLIRLILQAGADPRQMGPDGEDPLDYCLTRQRYNAARVLLAGGANPNARFDGSESWLSKSVREGDSDIALTLIESGAKVKDVRAKDGHTLLGWSIAHQMVDVTKALLAAEVDPDGQERSPAREEFRELFESNSFKYHLKVDRRITPIMMAAAHLNHEIAQSLMDAGANGRAYTPKYLMAAIIGSWYKDTDIQQIALLGRVPEVQPRKLVVDLSSQRATLYENGVATFSTRCSTGKSGYRTPTGEYVISDRHRHHNSSIYGSSMPYFQRFSFAAFGIHTGYVPNYPASHGCIRLPNSSASHLFGKLEVGDYAVIQP